MSSMIATNRQYRQSVFFEKGTKARRWSALSWLPVVLFAIPSLLVASKKEAKWSDDALVASYHELVESGGLEQAVRNPMRPGEAPQAAFLEALAWYAAGTPSSPGTLSLAQLDSFVDQQVDLYMAYLEAKVAEDAGNDYPRTRTWKVIQKLALLRDEMLRSHSGGSYGYSALPKATSAGDPWEWSHTLTSEEDFREKVCEGSKTRPVLVKYGNTNCTQCMLFELAGTIREFANADARSGTIDVYKVWWGLRPDETFAGRIQDPGRLNELAKAEGANSSPYFIVYRDGRRYPCGGAFPTPTGEDHELETCLSKASGEAPLASLCGSPS